ncbi:hypothetical protein BsWGS_29153 [Bradybaena similaris]
MEQLRSAWQDHPYIVAGALAVPTVFVLYRKIFRRSCQPAVECPPNTVLLFQLARGPYAPSLSCFPVKLETFLRMAKVPYVNDLSGKFSPKGKTPFMSYNGEIVCDSQFCIEYLNKKLNLDVNKDLNKEQRAIAKAIQVLVDEHLYWTLVYFRWVHDKTLKIVRLGFTNSSFLIWQIQRNIIKQLHGQGIGRHSTEEIKHIMMTDLQALTDYLGNKQFIMGPAPCEVDCSVFGMLSQFIWQAADDVCENLIQEKFPSLYSYAVRMRERFWPDWDDCITHGGTRPASK